MSGFVKLDQGILRSTLWMDRPCRDIFITALLMAEPAVYDEPIAEIATRTLDHTGWSAPPGWYGFVPAASVAIINTAGLEREEGLAALERLAAADDFSRSDEHNGRRMIRVNGGFLILNFMKYRDRDYTAAERMRRYRERGKEVVGEPVTRNGDGVTRNVTQAEAEAEAEADQSSDQSSPSETLVFDLGPPPPVLTARVERPPDPKDAPGWAAFRERFPARAGTQRWDRALTYYRQRLKEGVPRETLLGGVERYRRFVEATRRIGTEYTMQAASFLGTGKYWTEPWDPPLTRGETRTAANVSAAQAFVDNDNDGD